MDPEKKRNKIQSFSGRTMAAVVLIAGIVALAFFTLNFIRHRMAYAVSDAVFIRTDNLTTVGFDQVAGRLVSMQKHEGDPVRKGEVLAAIDDLHYRLAVDRLTAEIGAARKEKAARALFLLRLRKEIRLNEEIAAAKVQNLQQRKAAIEAKAAGLKARIAQNERDAQRYKKLYHSHVAPKRKAEEAATELAVNRQALKSVRDEATAIQAALASARKSVLLARAKKLQIQETGLAIAALAEKIKGLEASLGSARKAFSECVLKSPINGRVAKKFVSTGDVVSPNRAIYALVDPQDIFAMVLLEENKLRGVRKGCHADITIDAYPKKRFRGVVTQVLPASAATFALVPRDISAGEFTKVSQRIPVKIRITAGDISLLRIGLGGSVQIRRKASV